jgi:DNA-directed RNA polymerase II subunit RPB11
MNQPSRAEKFVLPDGVRKLTFTRDTKVANAGTYIVQKEDHTLGNIVRMQLHRDPKVVFAGYQVPHPSDNRIVIKVRRRSRPRAPRPRPVEPAPSLRRAPHASELRVSFSPPSPSLSLNLTPAPRVHALAGAHEQRVLPGPGDDGGCGPPASGGERRRAMRASDRKTCASLAATTPPSLARDRLTEPRAFSLPTQVTDLTQNFKDEVNAYQSNQGGF